MARPEEHHGDVEREFVDETSAAEAIKRLREEGIPTAGEVEYHADPTTDERFREDEGMDTWVGPSVAFNAAQGWGALVGTLVSGVIGVVAGVLIGFALRAAIGVSWLMFWIVVITTVIAATTVGFIFGGRGGGISEALSEQRRTDQRVRVHASPRNRRQAERAKRTLEQQSDEGPSHGARREGSL